MTQLLLNTINEEVIHKLAKLCHESNRRFCVEYLDDTSQPPWEQARPDIKKSALQGVRFLLDSGFPSSEAMHENWMKNKEKEGWVYGEEKSLAKKTHPCLVPYEDLPDEQRMKDFLFRNTVMSVLTWWSGSPQMGPQMPPLPYRPEPEPEPEPAKEEPKQEPKPDPVEVVDGSDEEVNEEAGGEPSAEGAGGAEETSDESSEDSTPKPSSKSRKK